MSSYLNLTQFAPALKQIYPSGVPESLTLKDHPFWGRLKKVQDFYGQNLKLPFRFADPTSVTRTFGTSLSLRATASSQYRNATLTRGHQYGVIQIDRETILASMNDSGAFLQARKAEIDGMINQLGNRQSQDVFGDGSGILGQISSTSSVASTTIALSDPNQIVNFEYGQSVVLTAARPAFGVAPTLRSAGASGFIVGVDRDAGTLTLSATAGGAAANWSTVIAAAAAGDFILQQGDAVTTSATSITSAIVGLDGWLPLVAPTAGDNYFSMDRSADPSRLAGIRFAGAGLPIEEVMNKCAQRVARDGARPDFSVMNYAQQGNLQTSLGAKIRYVELKSSGDARTAVTFGAFAIPGPKGDINVVADGDCPSDRGYMLQSDCWSFHHLSGAPELNVMGNVNGVLQEASADALQVRAMTYGQTMCDAPGWNAVFTLDQ